MLMKPSEGHVYECKQTRPCPLGPMLKIQGPEFYLKNLSLSLFLLLFPFFPPFPIPSLEQELLRSSGNFHCSVPTFNDGD